MKKTQLYILSLSSLALFSLAPAWADGRSGPDRQTILDKTWGTVFCAKGCTVAPLNPKAPNSENFAITTPDGRFSVMNLQPWIQIQAPNGQVLRIRNNDDMGQSETLVQHLNKNYRIIHRRGEIEWSFPDDHVYYKTMDGQLRDALGSKGSLKVRMNHLKNTYRVESQDNASDFSVITTGGKLKGSQKATYRLKYLEGDENIDYPYMYRGVLFQLGGVGLYIPLTNGKFTNALEWQQVCSYKSELAKGNIAPPPDISNNAVNDDDPLNLKLKSNKRQYRAPNPLNATTNSKEDPLKLKNSDGSNPSFPPR